MFMAQNQAAIPFVPGSREEIQRMTGYTINSANFLLEALDTSGSRGTTNRRLALVGDAVARVVIMEDWYPTGSRPVEGSDMSEKALNNIRLADVGRSLGLANIMVLNAGALRSQVSVKMLSTTVEAILGAVYLDSGSSFDAVRSAIVALRLRP